MLCAGVGCGGRSGVTCRGGSQSARARAAAVGDASTCACGRRTCASGGGGVCGVCGGGEGERSEVGRRRWRPGHQTSQAGLRASRTANTAPKSPDVSNGGGGAKSNTAAAAVTALSSLLRACEGARWALETLQVQTSGRLGSLATRADELEMGAAQHACEIDAQLAQLASDVGTMLSAADRALAKSQAERAELAAANEALEHDNQTLRALLRKYEQPPPPTPPRAPTPVRSPPRGGARRRCHRAMQSWRPNCAPCAKRWPRSVEREQQHRPPRTRARNCSLRCKRRRRQALLSRSPPPSRRLHAL